MDGLCSKWCAKRICRYVCVMISVTFKLLGSPVSQLWRKPQHWDFLGHCAICCRLCMVLVLTELCTLIQPSVTLARSRRSQIILTFVSRFGIIFSKSDFIWLLKTWTTSGICCTVVDIGFAFKRGNQRVSWLDKNFDVRFFSYTLKRMGLSNFVWL